MSLRRTFPARLRHWLSRAWHLPWRERLLLVAAWAFLALAALAIRILPARIYCRLLGRSIGAVACQPVLTPRQLSRARLIRVAIQRAGLFAPLRKDCLPQAITAAVLCRMLRVPSAVHLGTTRSETNGLLAHAWLAAGPIAVTGGHGWNRYHVVACFTQAPR
jgi:Transglutaminase-like superfamily